MRPATALYAITYNLINLEINYPIQIAFSSFYKQPNKFPNFRPAIRMSLPLDNSNSIAQITCDFRIVTEKSWAGATYN